MAQVFVSYVSQNAAEVRRLCESLENAGVAIWLDRTSIKPGSMWKDAIRDAIYEGHYFIACFSPEYHERRRSYMNEELALAIDVLRQYRTDVGWFVPVLLEECDVPALSIGAGRSLLDLQWVPLYEDWENGVGRILSRINPPDRIEAKRDLKRIAQRISFLGQAIQEDIYDGRLSDSPDDDWEDSRELEQGTLLAKYNTARNAYERRFHEDYDPLSDLPQGYRGRL